MSAFATRLVGWQRDHGRHDLPWQVADPYRVWLSEIMLQQTQVTTVIDYYQRFLARFPDIASLAAAPLDDVLALWSGLGYYSRARNLHKAAQAVMADFGGVFPHAPAEIETLPGIGRSTAAAIAAFSFSTRAAILDGNVKRVLARWAGIDGFPGQKAIENRLWALADSLLPVAADMPAYTQAQMDLGATVCTPKKPACLACPVASDCIARITGRQAELPTPKPKKAVPERRTVMLLIRDDKGRLLLQKRPPTGIWGGLWSLPETADTLGAERHCADALGLAVALEPAQPDFVHVFTHFKLTITPQPAALLGATALADNDTLRWFGRDEALAAGIPTPLRRLLAPG
ncbi:A/G-specific adenine glycosylase [Jeongeupia sp. USM3]|uniref:A/G-specific adenine glycosylase n=1 Tax=Jeongeupia sp. USM3 TaxID=1906741 RepID=UPI00089DEC69|nr:A/G-specific adenine glycosylase [Jeongeupia sp. USM3]AOY01663.1 A/G-specific adenine glycosylase [Jeongeupia sp. USM3]